MRARAARRGRGDAAPVSPPTTRRDGEEFLAVAAKIPIHVTTTPFALHDADRAQHRRPGLSVSPARPPKMFRSLSQDGHCSIPLERWAIEIVDGAVAEVAKDVVRACERAARPQS